MQNLEEIFLDIEKWTQEKGIDKAETLFPQMVKTTEEIGEIASCISKDDMLELPSEIADGFICLIILCQQAGIDPKKAIKEKFDIIAKRKGKLVNGVFVKES